MAKNSPHKTGTRPKLIQQVEAPSSPTEAKARKSEFKAGYIAGREFAEREHQIEELREELLTASMLSELRSIRIPAPPLIPRIRAALGRMKCRWQQWLKKRRECKLRQLRLEVSELKKANLRLRADWANSNDHREELGHRIWKAREALNGGA